MVDSNAVRSFDDYTSRLFRSIRLLADDANQFYPPTIILTNLTLRVFLMVMTSTNQFPNSPNFDHDASSAEDKLSFTESIEILADGDPVKKFFLDSVNKLAVLVEKKTEIDRLNKSVDDLATSMLEHAGGILEPHSIDESGDVGSINIPYDEHWDLVVDVVAEEDKWPLTTINDAHELSFYLYPSVGQIEGIDDANFELVTDLAIGRLFRFERAYNGSQDSWVHNPGLDAEIDPSDMINWLHNLQVKIQKK